LEVLAAAAGSTPVLQARWQKVEGSGDPGDYYWSGRGSPTTPAPGRVVPGPPLQHMEDTHSARSGGSMKSLRTRPDYPEQEFDLLAHEASQAHQGKGSHYTGPTEERGLGPTPVSTSIPTRDPGEHTRLFRGMTGGEPSSTKYQESLGTAAPSTKYNILHGMGHGEGGTKTQDPRNLASASEGANTYMIPYDKAVSGNPDVRIDSSFTMRKGTHRAEVVHQKFFHKDLPDEPFHEMDFDADLPKPTLGQYEQHEKRASRFKDREALDTGVTMVNLSRSSPRHHPYARKKQSTWGRLGQFMPGSHPLDPRPRRDDEGDGTV
jgi:hypothetical protein